MSASVGDNVVRLALRGPAGDLVMLRRHYRTFNATIVMTTSGTGRTKAAERNLDESFVRREPTAMDSKQSSAENGSRAWRDAGHAGSGGVKHTRAGAVIRSGGIATMVTGNVRNCTADAADAAD
eukprot:scpid1491/ scgid12884/ 